MTVCRPSVRGSDTKARYDRVARYRRPGTAVPEALCRSDTRTIHVVAT